MTGERERAREAARIVLDELIRNNPVRELFGGTDRRRMAVGLFGGS